MILSFPEQSSGALHLAEARSQRRELEQLLVEHDRLEAELFAAQAELLPWDPPAKKTRLWEVQNLLPQASEMLEQQVQLVESLYQQAGAVDGAAGEADTELADLYWRLLARAEERGDRRAGRRYLDRLGHSDADGRYGRLVEGTTRLELATEPEGARLRLWRLDERGRRLDGRGDRRELGRAPAGPVELAPGSYVLEVRHPGHATVRRPLVASRGAELQVRVSLFGQRQVGAQYVQVSAGRYAFGGDPRAPGAAPARQVFVDNFAISRHPVTLGEYLLFLDELAGEQPERALALTPRGSSRQGLEAADPRVPVTGVTFEAAEAYGAWLSASTGVTHRLPTEEEWEKAARGVDGRAYPWGEGFDPALCRMRESVPGSPAPCPVGSYEADASVYGAADMAGLVAEWTDSPYRDTLPYRDDFPPESGADALDDGPAYKVVRGGSFERCADRCRCASRAPLAPDDTLPDVGFRLVRPLPPGGGDQLMPPAVPDAGTAPPTPPTILPTAGPTIGDAPRTAGATARAELLAISQQMVRRPAEEVIELLLSQVVRLTGAERGFLLCRDEPGDALAVRACCSCTAGRAATLPESDQRYDAEAVAAALRQRRVIELGASGPLIAAPLVRDDQPGDDGCLLLERRFSAEPFGSDGRLLAETAADLLALALRLSGGSAGQRPRVGLPLEDAVAELERDLVERTLAAEKGNISRTARRLGLSRNGLRARLRRYDLSPQAYR